MTWPHAGLYGPESFTSPNGRPAGDAAAALLDHTGGSPVTLYDGPDRAHTVANPTTLDSLGNLSMWADPGTYSLRVQLVGFDPIEFPVSIAPNPSDAVAVGDWHVVGDPGEPGYENDWASYPAAATRFYRGERVWVELVTIGTPGSSVFTLPAGFLPDGPFAFDVRALSFSPDFQSRGGAEVDCSAGGSVVVESADESVVIASISFRPLP